MRSQEEISQEYEALCMRLGNLVLKRDDMNAEEARIRARVSDLNAEMTQVLAAPKANAPPAGAPTEVQS